MVAGTRPLGHSQPKDRKTQPRTIFLDIPVNHRTGEPGPGQRVPFYSDRFLLQFAVPIAVLHVVGLSVRPVYGAGNARVAPRPPAEVLKLDQIC